MQGKNVREIDAGQSDVSYTYRLPSIAVRIEDPSAKETQASQSCRLAFLKRVEAGGGDEPGDFVITRYDLDSDTEQSPR